MEIGHLHLLVNDVEKSKQFYLQTFGLKEIAVHDFGVILHDDSGMDFVIGPAEKGETQGQRMHFGFRLKSPAAVKEKFEQLNVDGQEFTIPYMENDLLTLFALHDPDGNVVEVYCAAGG